VNLTHADRDQAAVGQFADTKGKIDMLFQKVDGAIGQPELNINFRKGFQELPDGLAKAGCVPALSELIRSILPEASHTRQKRRARLRLRRRVCVWLLRRTTGRRRSGPARGSTG